MLQRGVLLDADAADADDAVDPPGMLLVMMLVMLNLDVFCPFVIFF